MLSDEVPAFGQQILVSLDKCRHVGYPTLHDVKGWVRSVVDQICRAANILPYEDDSIGMQCSINSHEPRMHGLTILQPLSTSSLVIHTVFSSSRVHVDLWSCQVFDTEAVLDACKLAFDGELKNFQVIEWD